MSNERRPLPPGVGRPPADDEPRSGTPRFRRTKSADDILAAIERFCVCNTPLEQLS
jgi:hypothetical protein